MDTIKINNETVNVKDLPENIQAVISNIERIKNTLLLKTQELSDYKALYNFNMNLLNQLVNNINNNSNEEGIN